MMSQRGFGLVLKTYCDQNKNRVLRTILDEKYITVQTITDYIPPLFMVINYEEAAFTRSIFFESDGISRDTTLRTDELLVDNIKFVETLLQSADCAYDALQFTFLRLETCGDYQRNFEKLYPLWNVGVGVLARLTFTTWTRRSRALGVLAMNSVNNSDVYTINYASNKNVVTIIDYMEPIFAYCVKLEKMNNEYAPQDNVRAYNGGKKESVAAAASTSAVFEIDFCLIDEPVAEVKHSTDANFESIFSESNTGDSNNPGGRRKKKKDCDVKSHTFGKNKLKTPVVMEKPRTMCGSLSVHDVSRFFAMLHATKPSRLSLDQLEELPVVMVRFEEHFCATTCCVVNRTDNSIFLMHVYYCWEEQVHNVLTDFANGCNRSRNNNDTMVSVSARCSEDIEARLRLLEDLRKVIWKENTSTYVRLAIDDAHDKYVVSRHIYEPLVFLTQSNTFNLESEIKRSVNCSRPSGSLDIFRNGVTLNCSLLCNDLDPKMCNFAKAYNQLLNDPTVTPNGSVRFDQKINSSNRSQILKLLEQKQCLYSSVVCEFRTERIMEIAFEMSKELRLGLLDLYGMKYNRIETNTSNNYCEDPSLRAANYVFLDTLLDSSMYVGSSGSSAACNSFFTKEMKVKPVTACRPGLYKQNMIEFDLKSAYPTVTTLYNISPETTAIVDRSVLKSLDSQMERFINTGYTNNTSEVLTPAGKHIRNNSSNVMTSVFNQVLYVNEEKHNLMIVSIKPEIYVGFLARAMEKLVLKRKNKNKLMGCFYKKLANVLFGLTGKGSLHNDLFSPQCYCSIVSLCKRIMTSILEKVEPQDCVLFSQTDGALLKADTQDGATTTRGCKALVDVVLSSIADTVSTVGNMTSCLSIEPNFRNVDLCLLTRHNQYLILYSDGKTVSKGQTKDSLPPSEVLVEYLLSSISDYMYNRFQTSLKANSQINNFLDWCFKQLANFNRTNDTDWSIKIIIPNNEEWYQRVVDPGVASFGDTISVWPVVLCDNNANHPEKRLSRPVFRDSVQPNHVVVVERFLRHWMNMIIKLFYEEDVSTDIGRTFYAICRKYESDLVNIV